MILRRIAQRLKAHDWTAVAIELLLVVLGVFIGIEVSNWNASRREHALEATYFERIAGDVRGDIDEMQEIMRVATVRMSLLNRLLREATGRELPPGFDSARGRLQVEAVPEWKDGASGSPGIALFILTTLDGNRSAYATVIATGAIGVMRDAAALRMVQDYYAAVDEVRSFEIGLQQNRDKLVDTQRRLGISPADPLDEGALAAAIAADPELRATTLNYWLYTNRHIKVVRELEDTARRLDDAIRRRAPAG